MKRFLLASLVLALVMLASTVYSAQTASLGSSNIAVKLDYIQFTETVVKDADVDTAIYLGIEGFVEISPKIYLGGEIGYAAPDGDVGGVGTGVTYIPLELNIKYAAQNSPDFNVAFGGGFSYIYIEEKIIFGGLTLSADDWLLGAQFFVDGNYTFGQYFAGANFKYQVTAEVDDSSYGYNNWKFGGQIGMTY
jgi:hypothetical protein